jgi:hypothetical protein
VKITLKEQLDHCQTCSTYVFSKDLFIEELCTIHILFGSEKLKPCPCSECIVKMMCTDQCLVLERYIVNKGK